MPKGIPGKPIIICNGCGEKKEHQARGRCPACYARWYRQERRGNYRVAKHRWEEKNPDKVRAMRQRGYIKNRPNLLAQKERYYRQNQDLLKSRMARWEKENLGKRAAIRQRRAARKQGLPDTLTGGQAQQKLSSLPCFYCGIDIDLTLDHFVPLANQNNQACGTTRANMVVACKSCNSRKHTALPQEFLSQLVLAGV